MNYTKNEAKEYAKEKLQGIFSAFCLPETPDGEIDEAGLRRDIRHYIDVIKSAGLYVHGFYGNFWLLTSAERRRVLEIVADESHGAVPLICRCAHQSMRETIDLIHHAERTGVDFISLIGPAYAGASDGMVYEYFDRIAAETSLGLSIFNTPQAGYVLSPQLMARLAEIPNVCALKNDIDMAHTIAVRHLVGDRIVVVDPSEEALLVNLTQFGQRVIYTGTNYMFDSSTATPMRDYMQQALHGNFERAGNLYRHMQPLRDLHHRWILEPWRQDGLCPIATIKVWTKQLGLTGGSVRQPLPQIAPAMAERLKREMADLGLGTI
jgi:4-hydroxy-tetrahydrodipicolinate synthase